MDDSNDVRGVVCCRPRTWSLTIGYCQTIGSILILLLELIEFTGLKNEDRKSLGLGATTHHLGIVLWIITVMIWTLQLVSGIFLILGVRQDNVGKVTVWFSFALLFVPLTTATAIWRLCTDDLTLFVVDIILLPVTIFCLWVVNIYRRQLLSYMGLERFTESLSI